MRRHRASIPSGLPEPRLFGACIGCLIDTGAYVRVRRSRINANWAASPSGYLPISSNGERIGLLIQADAKEPSGMTVQAERSGVMP